MIKKTRSGFDSFDIKDSDPTLKTGSGSELKITPQPFQSISIYQNCSEKKTIPGSDPPDIKDPDPTKKSNDNLQPCT